MGYFERQANVSGHDEVNLGFKAEEMNDVLKSLTVFDSSGGTVSSVSYDNQKPIARMLEESSLNIPSHGGGAALLGAIRGASVMVSAGNRMVAGQVVGVEERQIQTAGGVASVARLTIFDEGGALHGFDLHEISNVRYLDEHLKSELKFVFETLLQATKRDTKHLKLFARGEGERKLSISYVVECPIWKTSYRMAVSSEEGSQPYLQGWALVDNPQDEDWNEVTLSLVSGLPISFTHDLYSPRYLRRTEIEVQRESSAGPVMTEGAMMAKSRALGGSGMFGAMFESESDDLFSESAPEPMADYAMMSMPAPMAPPAPSRAQMMSTSQKVETVAQTVGQLFEYRIDQPVTVLRNQSALVPIVGSPFEGQRKILYNQANRKENPFAIIDFRNTTGLTLEGGPLTVYEDEVYAGEAMLDTLGPDEERMIPYAVDLAVEARTEEESDETVIMETFASNIWTQRTARYSTTTYQFSNKSDKIKQLILEHPIAPGKRINTPEPVSESRSYWRFAVTLPPRATTEFPVKVRVEDHQSHSLLNGDANWVLAILHSSRSHAGMADFLEKVGAIAKESSAVSAKENANRQKISQIESSQARLRQNLGALGQSHDEARLRSRYVEQLEQQEDELARLVIEQADLQAQRADQMARLRKLVAELNFEKTFEEARGQTERQP